MKDALYIRTRMDDVLTALIPQSVPESLRHQAKSETWVWCYNFGKLRTESELNNRLQNCKDELKCFEFMGEKSPMKLNPIYDKIRIIEDVLAD